MTKYGMRRINRLLTIIAGIIIITFSFINCDDDIITRPDNSDTLIASITSPINSRSYIKGDMIAFIGSGIDPEDGLLPIDSLVWTSDKDGLLGRGTSFSSNDLSLNTHLIALIITDSDGNTDADSVTIHVKDFDLVTVPATTGFQMGWEVITSIEEPMHTVSLDEYQIGKYETTYALWIEVKYWAESHGYSFISEGQQGTHPETSTELHPVTVINWRDCVAWCNAYSEMMKLTPVYYTTPEKVTLYRNSWSDGDIGNDCVDWNADGFRLPTEAEWEYAARYIDGTSISPGDQHSGFNQIQEINECAWYIVNSKSSSHSVGQLQSNSLSIYDMSGNVMEWCWDWIGFYPDDAEHNPIGPSRETQRIIRGGCWNTEVTYCFASNRYSMRPYARISYYGFRVCRRPIGE